ncbi:hypothetical protein GCM10023089_07040 [Quisquiliibacterium transsilvanicum]|jgi:hypothetical protein
MTLLAPRLRNFNGMNGDSLFHPPQVADVAPVDGIAHSGLRVARDALIHALFRREARLGSAAFHG